MDINDIRNVITVLSFCIFAGIVRWATAPRNKARFEEAQLLPFLDDETAASARTLQENRHE